MEARYIYSAMSRRARGLSLGVDLFAGAWTCDFDCVYCEVPAGGAVGGPFDAGRLRRELEGFFAGRAAMGAGAEPLRDICVAGSGEPCLSPALEDALAEIARARGSRAEAREAGFVIITNGSRLGDPRVAGLLARYRAEEGLEAWVKLDAGSKARFAAIDRAALDFDGILDGIASFARATPIKIQTMLLEWEGGLPTEAELGDYIGALKRLRGGGALIEGIQLYTVARAPREAGARAVPDALLLEWAARVSAAITAPDGAPMPVEAFGRAGYIGGAG